jgi:aerobic-type carbon monoxide dehydrogenase small subunit (CoxS/CutS family)
MTNSIHFILNGKKVQVEGKADDRMLLWALRNDLNLTGTKFSCGEGFCGACTVLVNQEPVKSCQYPLKDAEGKHVLTIEGLTQNEEMHPLQSAFIQHNALQCGFCTPGMILTAYSLLQKNPHPTEKEIIEAMEDNLCRCGTYNRIIQAITTAARAMNETFNGGRA